MVRLVRAHWRSEADRKPVPGIDRDDCQRQVHQFPFCKLLLHLTVDFIWHLIFADSGNRFRPGQRCPFPLIVERGLAPGGYSIKTLLAFAMAASILGMHIDTVSTAVNLGCA